MLKVSNITLDWYFFNMALDYQTSPHTFYPSTVDGRTFNDPSFTAVNPYPGATAASHSTDGLTFSDGNCVQFTDMLALDNREGYVLNLRYWNNATSA